VLEVFKYSQYVHIKILADIITMFEKSRTFRHGSVCIGRVILVACLCSFTSGKLTMIYEMCLYDSDLK